MKEDRLFVTECPLCNTEYKYRDISELNPIKGLIKGIYTKLGSNFEVWVTLVQCSSEKCGKLFIPVLKREEETMQVETAITLEATVPAVSPEEETKEVKKERPKVEDGDKDAIH